MSLIQTIITGYQNHTLKRIQRRFKKLQQTKATESKSQLRQWLLAADDVTRTNRRLSYLSLGLLLLLSASWLLYPILLKQAPETLSTNTSTAPTTTENNSRKETINKQLKKVFLVQLEIEKGEPETDQILEKIRQRPLPIEIRPSPQAGSNRLLLIDNTPTTRKDAERLRSIYTQLFGVEGEIIETTRDASI
ncbi:MAG: hypothetical protein HOL04_08955 [Gammaproteobacteria bacterium]|jgi:hypothetical protein|nr:hypothetical protein [Gammaproteobacteria bacterium]MBT4605655.1 hypothetical protein [Thiotrichales bacterium]MBT3473447.1 hypothetical protein [Gammaproteobacteria bacterium]MBT3968069.1 hypothetical protein [Gammaproteobacteria bacterium]MBT4079894.1 hypothetical protein [Gammaproteobacteria bacterium]